jgi:hypothetical protein
VEKINMAKSNKEYTRLPGSKKGFFLGRFTLWQGPDHLLHLFARFGVEDYKRFYFSDIQAIIIRKTVVGKIQNCTLAGLALMFLLSALAVADVGTIFLNGWAVFSIFMAAIVLVFLLINTLKGPTCETKLLTAVQTEKLCSLNRLKSALKVVDRLRPLIRRAQRSIPREEYTQTPVGPKGRNAPQNSNPARIAEKKDGKNDNGRAHMVLFGLLIFDGLLAASEFFVLHVLPTMLSSFAGLCIGIVVIVALVRQHNSDLPGALRTVTWICLGFVGLTFVAGYVVGMVLAFNNPSIFSNQWEIIKAMSNLSPWDSTLKLSYNILVICGALFIAMPGLSILQRSPGLKIRPLKRTHAATGQRVASLTPETG